MGSLGKFGRFSGIPRYWDVLVWYDHYATLLSLLHNVLRTYPVSSVLVIKTATRAASFRDYYAW